MVEKKPEFLKKLKSNKPRKTQNKKTIRWSHLVLLVLLLLFVIGASTVGTIILAAMSSMPSLDNSNILDYEIPSKIYDQNDELVEELSLGNNYMPVSSKEISPWMMKAVTSIEDKRFYSHHGIDPIRITGAAFSNLKAGHIVQGGSTITQQLAGLALLNRDEKTFKRKIQEAILALKIDHKFSKEEILTMYLNRCYFGIGLSGKSCYGIEAAAQDYFGKHASELNLDEASLLAGMIQNPSKWSPVYNLENAKQRRAIVLDAMYNNKEITEEELNIAKQMPINLVSSLPTTQEKVSHISAQSYVDYVINEAMEILNMDNDKEIYTGGYRIYTKMNTHLQDYMYNYFNSDYNFPGGASNEAIQAAMVVMDVKNGDITGLIGGRHLDPNQKRTFNRAYQSLRQPGSTFKPIFDYGPAFEEGYGTGSVELDKPYTSGKHTFKNADLKYHGTVTFREALINSYNTVAVRVLDQIGVDKGMDMAKKLGISTLVDDKHKKNDLNYSTGLGGLTRGVSVLDMAAAYATFADNGRYNKPHAITKIVDQQGRVIYTAEEKPKQVISPETAYMITSCLEDVIRQGTGVLAQLYDGRPVAGKTGTTDDSKDLWFAGYTPQYVGCVWVGFDNPAQIYATSDVTSRIFGAIMSYAQQGVPIKDFTRPEDLVNVLIDTKTGKLASRSTPSQYRSMEIFKSGTEPTEYSTYSKEWFVNNYYDENNSHSRYSENNNYEDKNSQNDESNTNQNQTQQQNQQQIPSTPQQQIPTQNQQQGNTNTIGNIPAA